LDVGALTGEQQWSNTRRNWLPPREAKENSDRPPEWQVPDHTVMVLAPTRYQHVLVIPVINEGTRLIAQLRRIAALDVPVDIVIADGGSTDGSVEPSTLLANGVRALLIKRGPGRLSAQLRMAYAWCLQEKYDGIITVDGNGKDDVSAISAFVSSLDAGYDYIQGSRYRLGGREENTPLDRKLAGRFVHAPMLSLAARRWYTDTTNGFRAYSRRYLTDPRLLPFRDVFRDYALLFYLTVRASRLRYRCCEIPVTRTYPTAGGTPTKIVGLRARWNLFGELLDVARGRFDPVTELR
jgi:dolichol-phosphate mannosyltransferase